MSKHVIHMRLMVIFTALIFILTGTGPLSAASFTADILEIHKGNSKTYKIYQLDQQYRLDVEEDGRTMNILVDRISGKTRVIIPSEDVYLEMDNDDLQSLSSNPFEARYYMSQNYEYRSVGIETINGLACEKQIISTQGKDVMTAWIASKYDFAAKLENKMDDRTLILENLRDGGVEASMFKVPTEYHLIKTMPVPPPDWAGEIRAAPIIKPPFEISLQEGQIVRIKPQRDFNIDLKVNSLSGTDGSFSSNAFTADHPLKRVTGFAGGGRKIHKESPDEADEIVVRAQSGQITVKAELVEAPEGMVLKSYDIKNNAGRQFSIDYRKASRLIVSDDKLDGKDSRGPLIIFTTIAKEMGGGTTVYDYKEVVRHELSLSNGASRTWHFPLDQQIGSVDITMLEGGVNVRVEQPEKPGIVPPAWTRATPPVTSSTGSTEPQETSPNPSPAAGHADAARMVLVLDASGSMWGQIAGRAKIEIAKEVLTELIDQIPPNFHTGLTVYGHRRKGDCKDIEMVIPVGPHKAAAMKTQVQGISPKGKTPLSESVRQAAQALRHTEERATVILVSDGLETCDIDPCTLAAELAMSGVDFTVHVIGFDISKEDQGRLRCLADKTGGLFLAASSASSLRDALFKTVAEVKEPPLPVVEDPGMAWLKGPAAVPAGSDFSVEWEGPDSRNDYIAISQKGAKDLSYKDYTYTKKGNPAEFTAPGKVGDYELRYVHSHSRKVIGRAAIKVTPVQATVQAPAEADVAVEVEVIWQGPDYSSDYIAIARPDQRAGSQVYYTYTSRGNPLKLWVPSDPGTYEIRYIMGRSNQLLAKTAIEINGVGASVQAPEAADVATEFEVTWQGPDNPSDYIAIASPDQKPGSQVNYTYTKKGSPLKVRAPSDPGTYEVRYILGRGSKLLAKTSMVIEAVGASVQAPAAAVMASLFEVSWQGPDNPPDYIAIARPDQKPGSQVNYTYTKKGSPLKVRAPSDPGTYEVRYILGRGSKLLAKTSIEIEAVSAKVQPPVSANVNAEFEVEWQGPDYKSDYISLARPDQRPGSYVTYTYTRRGNPVKIKAPKEAGTYEVRYILGRGSKILDKETITIK
jgi:Ca-activated chloride channel homolog